MNSSNNLINISFATFIRAAIICVVIFGFWILRDVIIVVLLSIVIASAIEPAARWFEKNKIPRVFGVIAVYFMVFLILFFVFYFIIPPLLGDLFDFINSLPQFIEKTFSLESPIFSFFPSLPVALKDVVRSLALNFQQSIPKITEGIISATSSIFDGVSSLILVIVISFYLAVQERGIENFLRIITPIKEEEYIINLWKRSQQKIGRWFQGQLLSGALIGIFVFLGLTILGVKYALLLAIIAAIFELIPVFGPVLAAIPAIAIAYLQGPILGFSTFGLFVIVQQFENHLIHPLVVRKIIGVPPILVIIALVVGGKLAGIYGIILSVPLAAVLIEFLNDLAERKRKTRI